MILLINILAIVASSLWTVFCGWLLSQHTKKIKQLELANKKLVNDINSLQRNQNVIVSSFKELHRIIRRYDKSAKKQLRIDSRNQA